MEVLFIVFLGGLITWTLILGFDLSHTYISAYDVENDKALEPATNFYSGFISAFLNVITIIFVYFSFKLQRAEINNNAKNSEFNRAVDVIYKQLEVSEIKGDQVVLLDKFKGFIGNLERLDSNLEMKQYINWYLTKALDLLFQFNRNFNIYKNLVYGNSLTIDEISILVDVVDTNYLEQFYNIFVRLLELYDTSSFMSYLDNEQLKHKDKAHWDINYNTLRSQYIYIYEQLLAVYFFSFFAKSEEDIRRYRNDYLILRLDLNKFNFKPYWHRKTSI